MVSIREEHDSSGTGPIAYEHGQLLSPVRETYNPNHFQVKPPVTFNTGDKYQIWKVARLLDQSGVGKGDLLTGAGTYGSSTMATPKAWPNQVSEPCYSWNNKNVSNGKVLDLGTNQPSIIRGA